MKRYTPWTDGAGLSAPMVESRSGDWVSFGEARDEIHELNNRLAQALLERDAALREANSHLKMSDQHRKACEFERRSVSRE